MWIQLLLAAKTKAARKLIDLIDSANGIVSIRASENILQLDKLDLSNTDPEQDNY